MVALEGKSEIKLRVPQTVGIATGFGRKAAYKPKLLRYIGPAFVVSVAYIDPYNSILTHRKSCI